MVHTVCFHANCSRGMILNIYSIHNKQATISTGRIKGLWNNWFGEEKYS